MRITRSGEGLSGILTDSVLDSIKKVFQVALIASVLMFGYLLYGLVSGSFADAAMKPDESRHALNLVNQISAYLNVSLVITLLCGILVYYDEAVFGFVLLAISSILAGGLQVAILLLDPKRKIHRWWPGSNVPASSAHDVHDDRSARCTCHIALDGCPIYGGAGG